MAKKILVADDDPGIQDIFKLILESAGYTVEVISNGEDILRDNYTIPDLFLLDKRLSGIDGLDVCIYLKNQENTSHIPIVMISANPGIGALSQDAGADDFIEKPFDVPHFLEMIEKHLNKKTRLSQ
ncbi:response regulator [Agriterribacter sp.]|uniref:response regulator n=1 Tax=Agriterribacter sp. TaxID=2821509 RepID=UPI002C66BA00|nr:response regulator [Agriterribacter sp.]HRP57034.1 response regulator [Agriterribacter sp.]